MEKLKRDTRDGESGENMHRKKDPHSNIFYLFF